MELTRRNYLCLLVAFLLTAIQSEVAGFDFFKRFKAQKEKYQDDYDLINEQLVRATASEEPLDNLVIAQTWLREKSGDLDDDLDQQQLPALARSRSTSRNLAIKQINSKALAQLSLLVRLLDRPKCNLFDFEVLRRNELSTGTRLAVPDEELGPLRRIDSVVRQVIVEHAEQCRLEYPKMFEWRKKSAPNGLLLEIRRMMNKIIETSRVRVFAHLYGPVEPNQMLKEKSLGVSVVGKQETRALLAHLRRVTREMPDSRYLAVLGDKTRRNTWMVDEEKVARLFNRFAVKQCERLDRSFKHILRPATFDQQVYPADQKYRTLNDETSELMIVLQYYRLCNELLEAKKTIEKNLVAEIWSEMP